jgi:hypothetical protein
MYNNRIQFLKNQEAQGLVMKSLRTLIILLVISSIFLSACSSLFSPVAREAHQWGSLIFHPGYDHVERNQSNQTWKISYENTEVSSFTGVVRHTSRINQNQYPMLTHDILVTFGDYADSSLVRTSVNNHRFIWSATTDTFPTGRINLIHAMPMNEDMLVALYGIKHGDQVTIKGYEIYDIRYYRGDVYKGKWKDAGCNTLLVSEVIIQNAEESP